ncbi:cell division protein FtsL [Bauldia sp.]|uniref:cell division protein FtsL n=1 Tax=Bauldia sp. TaxID=2575872 RepID=UPI003BA86893
MGRIFSVLLLGIMIAGAIVTYNLKHEAEETANKVARLHANVAREREAIALLKAEWSLLTQPSRLQTLIAKYDDHFRLQPFSAEQVATLDEIPLRPTETEAEAATTPNADALPAEGEATQ